MKKIKGLLLFGILTLLGIGSSFGYQDYMQSIMFKDNINQHINFNVFAGNSNVTSYSVSSIDSNGNVVSVPFLYKTTNSLNFDISHYSISNNLATYSYTNFGLYGDDSCLDLYYSGTSRSLLFHLFGDNNCNSSSKYIVRTVYGIYVNTNSSCIFSGVMTTGCNHNFYKIFNSQTYDSRIGQYADSNYSGNNLGKASISISFPDVYSFFTRYDLTSGGTVTEGNYDKFRFKTVYRSGDSFIQVPGVFMIRLNDYSSNYSITGFQVMVFALTGILEDGDITNNTFYYSIYSCPYNANYITDCSFSNKGGTFNWSFLSYSFTGNIFNFFGTNATQYSRIMTNSYNGINLVFHRPGTTSNYGYQDNSFSVGLISDGNNYFESLFPGGGGNGSQSTGSIAINTGFLDLCLNNLQFGELNSYLCNKLFDGNNLVLIPGQTGYYLSYGYDENGNLRFWLTYQEDLEEQMSGYIREQDENGNWYTYLPEESNTGVDNSDGLKDYFNNWFEHGVFFSCPFHYTDSYYREFKLFGVSHFVPKLGQSFLYPIYCMGAGFREGKNIDFFSGVNLGLESQLLSSSDYNYLYRLFDLILSVLIMFFIIKIYHLLN